MRVQLFIGDINDVDADIVAIPIGTSLRPLRRAARALFAACGEVFTTSLAGRSAALGDVVIVPAPGHPRARAVALVVLHSEDAGAGADTEPTPELIERASERLFAAADGAGFGASLAFVPLGGFDLDVADGLAPTVATLAYGRCPTFRTLTRAIVVARDTEIAAALRPLLQRTFHFVENAPLGAPVAATARFGVARNVKASSKLAFESLQESCGSSVLPVGCTGVAFRLRSPRESVAVVVRVHAPGSSLRVWLDGLPLDDPRVHIAPGYHALALEIRGARAVAALIAPVEVAPRGAVAVRTSADGSVVATTQEPSPGWLLADAPRGSFGPLTLAHDEVPPWAAGAGLALPTAERVWVRFAFPLLFGTAA